MRSRKRTCKNERVDIPFMAVLSSKLLTRMDEIGACSTIRYLSRQSLRPTTIKSLKSKRRRTFLDPLKTRKRLSSRTSIRDGVTKLKFF